MRFTNKHFKTELNAQIECITNNKHFKKKMWHFVSNCEKNKMKKKKVKIWKTLWSCVLHQLEIGIL